MHNKQGVTPQRVSKMGTVLHSPPHTPLRGHPSSWGLSSKVSFRSELAWPKVGQLLADRSHPDSLPCSEPQCWEPAASPAPWPVINFSCSKMKVFWYFLLLIIVHMLEQKRTWHKVLLNRQFSCGNFPAQIFSKPAPTLLVMALSGAWSKAIKMNGKLSIDINELWLRPLKSGSKRMTAAMLEIDGNLWSAVVQNTLIFTWESACMSSMRSIDPLQL